MSSLLKTQCGENAHIIGIQRTKRNSQLNSFKFLLLITLSQVEFLSKQTLRCRTLIEKSSGYYHLGRGRILREKLKCITGLMSSLVGPTGGSGAKMALHCSPKLSQKWPTLHQMWDVGLPHKVMALNEAALPSLGNFLTGLTDKGFLTIACPVAGQQALP